MSVFGTLTLDERARVRRCQAESFTQQLTANYLGNLTACAIVALAIRNFVSPLILLSWVIAFVTISHPYWRSWSKRWQTIKSGWRIGGWEFRMALTGGSMAALWTVPGLLLPAKTSVQIEILLTALAIGMTSLATVGQNINVAYSRSYAVIIGVPFIVRYILSGNEVLFAVGALAVPFLAYLFAFQVAACRRALNQIRHEIEIERLSSHLTHANQTLQARLTEVESLQVEADQANRAKSIFLAKMSHELRTPLNAILGFSELMGEDAFAAKASEYAKLIHQSGSHLLALVNDILDLAKIEAGRTEMTDSEIDVTDLISGCLALVAAPAHKAQIYMKCDIVAGLPRLRADERAVKQILLNLISNSMKFTRPFGEVIVSAKITKDSELVLAVEDTGVGISPEDTEWVFENFGQGRHDAATTDKGTGLGLPIVKGLVEAHGGRVELESTVGVGTMVSAYFPAERLITARKQRSPAVFSIVR
jgi:signal transduction histidine kinase